MSDSDSRLARRSLEARQGRITVLSGFAGGWDDATRTLEEIRRAFQADEASLLLFDSTASFLVPVATSGIERPVHEGFRVPVGSGFAGEVAATGRPVVQTEVNAQTVLNPAIHQRGIKTLLGVPVPGPQGIVGVAHVGTVEPRAFGPDDVRRIEEFAAVLGAEVWRRRAREEHVAALTLQRSLLPGDLPKIPGLDIAARYIPADSDLGGDWYDVFELPDQRVGVVMGDVAGHGLEAAVVMGRLRSALRAYALEHENPAEVLALLDTKISHFEAGAMATVLYAVAASPYLSFEVSSAGHLPPVRMTNDEVPEVLAIVPDPPVGVGGSWERHSTTVDLPAGASLCMFTDGLIERRPTSDTDQLATGTEELLRTLRPGHPADTCELVLELLGDAIHEDDIALLILRPHAGADAPGR